MRLGLSNILFAFILGHLHASAASTGKSAEDSGELLYNVQLQPCPRACEYAGPDPSDWTSYHDPGELVPCNQTLLFTLNVYNSLSDLQTQVLIKACSTAITGPRMTVGEFIATRASFSNPGGDGQPSLIQARQHQAPPSNLTTLSSCGAMPIMRTSTVEMAWSGSPMGEAGAILSAAAELARYFGETAGCGSSVMFAYSERAVVGVVAGADLVKSSAADLINQAKTQLESALPGQLVLQACHPSADHPAISSQFGFFADPQGNISNVQRALRTWVSGGCLDLADVASGGHKSINSEVSVLTSPFDDKGIASKDSASSLLPTLNRRADCRVIQVVSGDSCGSLATRCGISGSDFTKYNSYNNQLCSTLKVKQYVCCSAGTLPDMRPKPNADGTCRSYIVQKDDGCWAIADAFGITQDNIEQYNKQTWGWARCLALQLGQVICLSSGIPPMPSQDRTMNCGPQVPGTQRPASWADISKLNPCPLNACCNIWGQCGTTEEFCTPSPADTGAPGTARPGTNGCISNCGTGIVNNADKPASFARVGYFEAWNAERHCLNMDISQFDTGVYSHVHFAFATITPDYRVNISGVEGQFSKMKTIDMKGTKKILSFGGWSFSTSQDSYPIFRNSVTAAMAQVVDYFVYMTYDLHGQWDYDNKCHINITETENALSMVTKAGAPAKKVMLGVSSYGRSFRMANPSCSDPMCKFTSVPGKPWQSDAEPGECTGTPGYSSDAEIRGIQQAASLLGEPGEVQTWHDHASNSDVMTWNGNWVAYMTPTTKKTRAEWTERLNFGGIADWAVDLERSHAPLGQPDDGEDDQASGERPLWECTADYADLDAVSRDANNIPAHCWAQYILATLSPMLDNVTQQYNEVVRDYDDKFGYYAKYVNELVDPQLRTWLAKVHPDMNNATSIVGKGNRFFTCKFRPMGAQAWEYDGPCPVPHDKIAWPYDSWDIEYTLQDPPGFEAALRAELGMGLDWIQWGTYDPGNKCGGPSNPGHGGGDPCDKVYRRHIHFPLKTNAPVAVPNPKAILTAALPNITTLQTQILAAYAAVGLAVYDGDGDERDAARALGTPVFMLAQAVESMRAVREIGERVEEEEKKRLILLIVSVVLMVGEVGFEVARLAQLARFAFIAGEVGNGVMGLVDVARDPESAPFVIMGMLMGAAGRGMRAERVFEQAAEARKPMSQADVARLGKMFKEKDALVSGVIDRCVR